jgi:hypothetical protein
LDKIFVFFELRGADADWTGKILERKNLWVKSSRIRSYGASL